jgi:hypothetical protein
MGSNNAWFGNVLGDAILEVDRRFCFGGKWRPGAATKRYADAKLGGLKANRGFCNEEGF